MRFRHRCTPSRVLGGAVALVLGVTSGVLVALTAAPANAADTALGGLTFSPATGRDITPISATTVSTGATPGCPTGTTNVRAVINGPGNWQDIELIGNSTSGVSTTEDFSEPFADSLSGIAASNQLSITAGRYDISLICQNRLGSTVFGTFTAPLFFTDATHYQSSDPSAQTTTTVVSATPASPQPAGTTVAFTATVSPSSAVGTVQFKDGTANLGSSQSVTAGHATLSTNALTMASHSITAVFIPASPSAFAASTSAPITYVTTSSQVTTSTVVSASPSSPQTAGTPVTFTATVTPSTAVGTVQFTDSGTNLGSAQPVSAGTASLSATSLSAGAHSIAAVFTPTDSSAFTSSTAATVGFVINAPSAANTATTLTASPPSPVLAGSAVTFTATISPSTATGTVQFKDGSVNMGAAQAVSGGIATLMTSSLTAATHPVTAEFVPADATAFNSSISAALPYTVMPTVAQSTSTALAALPASPATPGTPVTFTATVSPSSATGLVQFEDGGANLGSAQTVSGGTATFTTAALSAATHTVTAVFTPADASAYTASTSPAVAYLIASAGTATSTALAASPASPAALGASVTFTASVTPASAAGTVQFVDRGSNLATPQAVSGGIATLSTTALTAGTHSITAMFLPIDPSAFQTSTSVPISYVVGSGASTSLGTLSFSPATGSDIIPLRVTTHSTGTAKGCPVGTTNVQAVVNGPTGWTDILAIGNTTNGVSTTEDFTVDVSDSFSGLAQSNSIVLRAGRYDVTLDCQDRLGRTLFGTFTGSVFFTDANHYQSTDPNNSVSQTTTTLAASPDARQDVRSPVTLTATLTPASAVGKVQFEDTVGGTTGNVGAAVTVNGGTAKLVTSSLPFGMHIFTAVFTPTDATKFSKSSSTTLVYVVALPIPPKVTSPAHLIGSGAIGSMLRCAVSYQRATSVTYAWYRNGRAIVGARGNAYLLKNADRVRLIVCRATAKNLGGSTPSTSPGMYAGLLHFRLLAGPGISGRHVVGATLKTTNGRWIPNPLKVTYQWLRDSKTITGATRSSYKVVKADMGHKLSVRVTVNGLFYYAASAVSRTV